MVTVPHVLVASVLSASHLPTGAGAVPIFWEEGEVQSGYGAPPSRSPLYCVFLLSSFLRGPAGARPTIECASKADARVEEREERDPRKF